MLSYDEVKHILDLSSLDASEEEVKKLQGGLGQMQEFISQINNADVDDEISYASAVSLDTLREDEAKPSMSQEEILQNAPVQKFNSIDVPLMMED